VLPIEDMEEAKLLPVKSPLLRLRLVVHWIEQLNRNWWFTNGCIITCRLYQSCWLRPLRFQALLRTFSRRIACLTSASVRLTNDFFFFFSTYHTLYTRVVHLSISCTLSARVFPSLRKIVLLPLFFTRHFVMPLNKSPLVLPQDMYVTA